MNDIVQLKGQLHQRDGLGGAGQPKLSKNSKKVDSKHLNNLANSLKNICQYWDQQKIFDGLLIDVYHTKIVPKSSRLSDYFVKTQGAKTANDLIVGSRFTVDGQKKENMLSHITSMIESPII